MKVVFLDRDGTTIVDPPDMRVDTMDKLELFPDSIAALKLLAEHEYSIIFITNQAAIGEGTLTVDGFEVINNEMIERLKPSGANILKTYFCPHSPNDKCECRKPSPKMILQAAEDFDVDLASSYMVGDRLTDLEAGISAGTKTILVKTGIVPVETDKADYQADSLLKAAEYIVAH